MHQGNALRSQYLYVLGNLLREGIWKPLELEQPFWCIHYRTRSWSWVELSV